METRGSEDDGLSNIYIDRLLNKIGLRRYRGTFSCNNIPSSIAKLPHFSIICNLDKVGEEGSHFVTVVGQPEQILYMDPLALPCTNPSIAKFIEEAQLQGKRSLKEQKRQIQHPLSKYCGFYCMLYTLYYECDKHNIEPEFYQKNLLANDSRCFLYMNILIIDILLNGCK